MMKGFFTATMIVMLMLVIVSGITYSCVSEPKIRENEVNTNVYGISIITIVPDSLQVKYAEWIKETVRAASQNMTGGDYEDADDTIEQAQVSGLKVFGVEKICLRVHINEYEYMYIAEDKLNTEQKIIFQKLINKNK